MFKKKEKAIEKPMVLDETNSRGEWMQKYWRPCAAFMYMICCLSDFAIFPIMFTVVQFWETEKANDAFRQWVPITLQGGGLFHVSMCAVLGVSAYGRTQEKLAGSSAVPDAVGTPSPVLSSATPAFTPAPTPAAQPAAFAAPSSFGSPASSFGNSFGAPAAVATTAGGKKIVPDAEQPLL
jgi:hypothetical protein